VVSSLTQQQVPEGYQQTEVGLIPSGWDVKTIGDLTSDVGDGIHSTPVYSSSGAYYFVNGNNIVKGAIRVTDDTKRVDENEFKKHKKSLSLRTIFLSINGTIGNLAFYNNEPLVLGKSAAYMNVKEQHSLEYVYYGLQTKSTNDFFSDGLTGSTIKNLGLGIIRATPIPMPANPEEQTAIANALSDVDALITSLEKLIAKKRAIKTAAMQQLLTGKKRLPPFDKAHTGYKQTELGEIPADWEIVGLGRLFEPKLNRKRVSSQDDVTFVGMQDVTETAKINNMHKVKYSEVKSGFTYFERNDVLVAKITPCFENGKGGYADVIDTQVGFGSTEFHVLRARDDVDSKYLFYFTNTVRFRSELESEMVGSAGHRRVPFSSVQKFRAAVTLDKEEQKAIANTLSEMDFEIDAVVSRLKKTQQIKQGMMQELLAGKTRLF
jgi:type I restriction enzyme S subunit